VLLYVLAAALSLDAGKAVANDSRSILSFMLAWGELSVSEVAGLERGKIVAKVLDTGDRSEVLTFAASRVKASSARVADRLREVEEWRKDPWVVDAGRLAPLPGGVDLSRLTLDPGDIKDLSRCRLYQCDVRLPADAIERFRQRVDWKAKDRDSRASEIFREMISGYAAAYSAQGNQALFEYANNHDPVHIGDGLKLLTERSGGLAAIAPDLYSYLSLFPDERPADIEDFLYWVKEKFWVTNVLSVNHITLISRNTSDGRLVASFSKQLYATHYYEAALGLTAYIELPSGQAFLLTLNRVRADIRKSGFNWAERLLLNRLARNRVESQLSWIKQRVEAS
jgi:hypothetical protein